MKINPADTAFSWCVRERADWTCEYCGLKFMPPTKALQNSHFITRGNWSTRYEPLCCDALCGTCHFLLGGDPYLYTEWKLGKTGQEGMDILNEKKNDPMIGKEMRHQKKEIAKHYRLELLKMQKLRAQGISGRLEFVGY